MKGFAIIVCVEPRVFVAHFQVCYNLLMPNPHDTTALTNHGSKKEVSEMKETVKKRSKRISRNRVRDAVDKLSVDPAEELVKLALDETIPKEKRADIWEKVLSYLSPKMKSIDLTADVQHEIEVKRVMFSEQKALEEKEPPPIDLPPVHALPVELDDDE